MKHFKRTSFVKAVIAYQCCFLYNKILGCIFGLRVSYNGKGRDLCCSWNDTTECNIVISNEITGFVEVYIEK